MPSHRSLRIAEAIREVVASAVLFEVSDPRVRGVTVLRVEVGHDLRNATVYVTVMGSPGERSTAMKGLRSATGFLQSKVAARLQIRFVPILTFKLDEGVKKSVEMGRLIEEAVASDRKPDPAEGDGTAAEPPGPAGDDDEDGDEDEAEDD
ncbi:MAG: ribosome-binding factor A [Planctomycetales bacterium 71-10]|nr:MAG: ribosome-binding factor A [Planctomycetales bacterium 71-10]